MRERERGQRVDLKKGEKNFHSSRNKREREKRVEKKLSLQNIGASRLAAPLLRERTHRTEPSPEHWSTAREERGERETQGACAITESVSVARYVASEQW